MQLQPRKATFPADAARRVARPPVIDEWLLPSLRSVFGPKACRRHSPTHNQKGKQMDSAEQLAIQYVLPAFRRYLEHGTRPGEGLNSLIKGDLFKVRSSLSQELRPIIWEILDEIWMYFPCSSIGSPGTVAEWCRRQSEPETRADVSKALEALNNLEQRFTSRIEKRRLDIEMAHEERLEREQELRHLHEQIAELRRPA